MSEILQIDTVEKYNRLFGIPTLHPLVSVVDLSRPEQLMPYKMNFGFYALFLKREMCGELTYGRGRYDYADGTLVAIAPGQIVGTNYPEGTKPPSARGVLFHPDLIRGTVLGQEMKNYTFFSYEENEACHHSVIQVPGTEEYYIVYHRRPLGDKEGNHRVTCIDRMTFDKQGHINPVKITFEGVEARPIR